MSARIPSLRRDERGVSMGELLMGMLVFLIVFTAIVMMVQAATHNQGRIARRVVANQKARPVLTRLIDQLHSACIAPGAAPILAGSTDASLQFITRFGSAVSPVPEKHVITYTAGTSASLSETIYDLTSGTTPQTWVFSSTPRAGTPRVLLKGVSQGRAGTPSVTVPVFRYYAYVNGIVSSTPLPVVPSLSATDAARTVQVDVAFASSSGDVVASDPNDRITFTDSTTLRLEPASEDSAEVNLPCV